MPFLLCKIHKKINTCINKIKDVLKWDGKGVGN